MSNSSTASFVIAKEKLSALQLCLLELYGHGFLGEVLGWGVADQYIDSWFIRVDNLEVCGFTYMDNGDMERFLKDLGVKRKHIRWDRDED